MKCLFQRAGPTLNYICGCQVLIIYFTKFPFTVKSLGLSVKTVTRCWNMDPSQYKDVLSMYGNFHSKDNIVMGLYCLYNGNTYTGKTQHFYSDENKWVEGVLNHCGLWYTRLRRKFHHLYSGKYNSLAQTCTFQANQLTHQGWVMWLCIIKLLQYCSS